MPTDHLYQKHYPMKPIWEPGDFAYDTRAQHSPQHALYPLQRHLFPPFGLQLVLELVLKTPQMGIHDGDV